MGVATCAINAVYATVCQDPDTAAGGLTPGDTTTHAPHFQRHVGEAIDTLPGDGLDRKVQVVYNGTDEWHPYSNSVSSTRMRTFGITVRIGYFAGAHVDETHAIMADDDQLISNAMALAVNWPSDCTGGCVNGIMPGASRVLELDRQRYILEIDFTVQVTA